MRTTKILGAVLLALVAIGLLASCSQPGQQEPTTGIRIVGVFHAAKSILPPISMDVAEWRVVGSGAGSFDEVLPLEGGTITNLSPGDWHLVVTARNAAHDALGEGTVDVTVIYGQTTTANVTVLEYTSPNGAVSGSISYEPDIVESPSFSVTLTKSSDGSVYPMPYILDLEACTGTGLATDTPPGWYSAVGILLDFDRPSTGFAAAVRVAAGRTTNMTIAMHAVQTHGRTGITFSWSGFDELEISGSPAPGPLQVYEGQLIPMSVSSPEPGITAKWYINGVLLYTGTDINLNADDLLQTDFYRLDCLAFSADNLRGASLTWNVSKGAADPMQFRISGHAYDNGYAPGAQTYEFKLYTYDPGLGSAYYGTVIADGAVGDFAFEALPPGVYGILGHRVGTPSGDAYWWTSDNSHYKDPNVPPLGRITIPQSGSEVFNFPDGF